MSEHNMNYLVTFDCLHTVYFKKPAPKIGDELWCLKCQKYVHVIEAPDEWKIRCMNCMYSRKFGAAKTNAEISAGKHRRNRPGHKVKIFNGNKLIRIFGERDAETQSALF